MAFVCALACSWTGGASAASTILVKFAHPATAAAKVAALGDDATGSVTGGVTVVDPQPGEGVASALADYRGRPDVVYAEPNRVLHLFNVTTPNDSLYGSQWALPAISAVQGWSVFPATFSAVPTAPVGIVDTGVDATHEDLVGRISPSSATCVSGACTPGVPTDGDGHGTHVAGIAGAIADNGLGVAGLAYDSPLVVVRVFPGDASQGAALSDVADGIAWAAQHGAKVINLSLGTTGGAYPVTLCNAVQTATSAYGAVVVAAAGNGDPPGTPVSTPTYPAACPGAIGVAATDLGDLPGTFSNYGSPDVFVSAPGVSVLSTLPGNSYGYLSGTSMASPYVTALVGLIRSLHPEASVAQVREILALSAAKVGSGSYGADPYGTCAGCTWDQHYGYGRIDVARALATAVPTAPPAAPPPPPAPAARDTSAPFVRVYAASGRPHRLVRLRYHVQDDSGRTAERLLVYRRTKPLRTLSRPLRTTDAAVAYWVGVTFAARGSYRYCVRATDAAGNHSGLACARIRIR
ncbi:MAG TPA: S8 family serine peptidase [Gaiellaceae bacterium]|nr:S8 family serine peptidase [Gaiellaceae bacterium]